MCTELSKQAHSSAFLPAYYSCLAYNRNSQYKELVVKNSRQFYLLNV